VHLGHELHPAHADGILDAALDVDDEFLGEQVQHLLLGGDGHGAGDFDHLDHVLARDLAALDGEHPLGVGTLDVGPRDAGVHARDVAGGHALGLVDGLGDRRHARFDIDDGAAFHAGHRRHAEPDRLDAAVLAQSGDEARHLGRADVEPDEQISIFPHLFFFPFDSGGGGGAMILAGPATASACWWRKSTRTGA